MPLREEGTTTITGCPGRRTKAGYVPVQVTRQVTECKNVCVPKTICRQVPTEVCVRVPVTVHCPAPILPSSQSVLATPQKSLPGPVAECESCKGSHGLFGLLH